MQAQLAQLHQQLVPDQAPPASSGAPPAITPAHRQVLAQIQHEQQRLLRALGVPPSPHQRPTRT